MGPAGSLSGDARTFSHGAPHHDTTHRDSRERFHSDPDRYRFPGKYEAHEASCDGTLRTRVPFMTHAQLDVSPCVRSARAQPPATLPG
ncbi:hypothetical protein CacPP4_17410 [Cutibacterium acnes subsp. acnes]|uniref:Uncharacterized protein n=1 Tax=Cutibacterium acnes subsp. acnes TaxID=1734925 RepID=A0ABM7H112_CUTAC|nr:hypothetical protein PAZ_c18970 [Cutibacterium acnes 266]BBK85126.1 hypothetical protein CacPP4_17410 [Cutibacterium acnes subsp. acnes]